MLLSMRGCKKHKRAIIRFWPHKCTPLSLNRTHSIPTTPKRMSIICNSNDPSLYILMQQSNRAKTKEPFFRPNPFVTILAIYFNLVIIQVSKPSDLLYLVSVSRYFFSESILKVSRYRSWNHLWWFSMMTQNWIFGRILENHSM